jgi:ubiquinone/menaquinone biosynthesis C-methylase UbiE
LVGDIDHGKVLDVGCGPGMMVDYLVNQRFQYFGLDLSKAMIEECRRRYGHLGSAHFIQGEMENLPFPDCTFDVIFCLGAIEYVLDIDFAVRELSRVTKANGFVIISMLNRTSPYRFWYQKIYQSKTLNLIRKWLKRPIAQDSPILHMLTEKQLMGKLASNKLRAADVLYYDFNLFVSPFDHYFPRLTVNIAQRLEFLGRTRLAGLGTGFIVKTKKEQN